MIDFQHFGISSELMSALEDLGFENATPIQQVAIPKLLTANQDFIGLAHTGTGKTAAFGIPLIENIELEDRFTQSVVIAPTRELVKQIEQQLQLLAAYHSRLRISVVYGGVSISAQIRELRKPPHILIATPGRLLDLIDRKIIVLKDVSTIVLDEADEMLNMGFKEDIDRILEASGKEFKIWLFSATFPKEIRKIATRYMDNPIEYAVDSVKEINASIKHEFCLVKGKRKVEILRRLLDSDESIRGIVFCRTKKGTQSLADELSNNDYKVEALHGDMSQAQRERVMHKFRNFRIQMLVATDVAARGIDVQDLSHIIHFDMPDDPAYYTHRSGRTGRAGKTGVSILFVPPSQDRRRKHFERQLKVQFKKAKVPTDQEIATFRIKKWATEIAQTKELEGVNPEIHAEVFRILSNFSKDELIEKITTLWLKNSRLNATTSNNEVEPPRKNSQRSIKESRSKKGRDSKNTGNVEDVFNYYINVGYVDGVGKRDLLTYLAEQSGIEMHLFQNLEMFKKHAFFDAPKKMEGKLISSFRSVKIGNRKLRVNRNQN